MKNLSVLASVMVVLFLAAPNKSEAQKRKAVKIIEGTISGYKCGDNCYLTITDNKEKEHTGLCTAPVCTKWNENAMMPDTYKGKRVKVTVGKGTRFTGAGDVVDTFDAFTRIQFIESDNNEMVNLAPSWHGDWENFTVETSGDFVQDKVRYKWIGSRAQLPQKAGCWAFYDGVTSKSKWVLSFKGVKSDMESKKNLAQLSDERFKLVTLVCTEKNGEEIPIGADCIHSGYFYDKGSIYEPVTCQIGLEFVMHLHKIIKK